MTAIVLSRARTSGGPTRARVVPHMTGWGPWHRVEVEIDGRWWPLTTEHKPWVLREGIAVLAEAPEGTFVVVDLYPGEVEPLRIDRAIRSRALADLCRRSEEDDPTLALETVIDLAPDEDGPA